MTTADSSSALPSLRGHPLSADELSGFTGIQSNAASTVAHRSLGRNGPNRMVQTGPILVQSSGRAPLRISLLGAFALHGGRAARRCDTSSLCFRAAVGHRRCWRDGIYCPEKTAALASRYCGEHLIVPLPSCCTPARPLRQCMPAHPK